MENDNRRIRPRQTTNDLGDFTGLMIIKTIIQKEKINFIDEIPSATPFYVYCAPADLIQVLLNLIMNSTKYNRDGDSVNLKFRKTQGRKESIIV